MGIQSRFVYLRHFGLRTKINFCINTVFVCFFAWGKTLHTKNQNIHFSNSSSSFAELSKFIKFFFSCLSFFSLLQFPGISLLPFSTAAPPGGSREQQLVSFKYCNGIKFVQEVINGLG